ncbi:VOC family protein [Lentzea tibetensis]|uniref:VOC family protein n=1 Tax=Lentzea tibetensis TaxID=2591470 RepID=A0A563EHK8_9PSEU|nr:VOC family protein [Lentzea tibetensis]TWP45827.1 VOC family protein [Lentzea tibetensis]
MNIDSVFVRLRVDDLDAAVVFYERITGETAARFAFADVSLARIGPFLLFSGSDEAVRRVAGVAATLSVADLDVAVKEAIEAGAEVVMPAVPTPNGRRAVVRHPHGGVFEYVGP